MFSRMFLVGLLLFSSSQIAQAGQPDDKSKKDDSRSSTFDQTSSPIPREIGGKSYEDWKRDLKHADPSIRSEAIRVLPAFREKAADAVPTLCQILKNDPDASPRVKAAMALRMMYLRPTDRVDVIKALGYSIGEDPQSIIRYESALTLQQPRFGRLKTKEERQAIAGLVKSLNSGSTYELREICIRGLIVAGPDPNLGPEPTVTDSLIRRAQLLNEPAFHVRLEAIMALGALGRPQDPRKLATVLDFLNQKSNLHSSHKSIQIWTNVALMSLSEKVDDKYLKTIAAYLSDRDRETKVHAVMAFGALEEKSHDYLSDICKMMRKERDVLVLEAGCQALGQIGDQGEKVIGTLIEKTEEGEKEQSSVVLAACAALAHIGLPSKEVLDAMNKVLEYKSLDRYQKDLVKEYIKQVQKPKEKDKKREKRELQGKTGNDRNRR
jgi:HEAT repeat protein